MFVCELTLIEEDTEDLDHYYSGGDGEYIEDDDDEEEEEEDSVTAKFSGEKKRYD